ncbi:MAG: hypothetical protein MK486_19205, partial [Gemmatimonadetes bacterium]|nr:hypothetical protein [Gemmatimonadota bacterium]
MSEDPGGNSCAILVADASRPALFAVDLPPNRRRRTGQPGDTRTFGTRRAAPLAAGSDCTVS